MEERFLMRKEVTVKEDGRYLIYYHFAREPLPESVPKEEETDV